MKKQQSTFRHLQETVRAAIRANPFLKDYCDKLALNIGKCVAKKEAAKESRS